MTWISEVWERMQEKRDNEARLLQRLGWQMQEVLMDAKDREGTWMVASLSMECPVCQKKYHKRGWLKRHMDRANHWRLESCHV